MVSAQRYIDLAGSLEGLSPKVPLYKITEGNEPCFFTTYFSWDATKATVSLSVLEDMLWVFRMRMRLFSGRC